MTAINTASQHLASNDVELKDARRGRVYQILMGRRKASAIDLILAITWSVVAALGSTRSTWAADLTFFQATPIKAPECVTDTTGYFYAEESAPVLPSHLSHSYLVVRHMGLGAVDAAAAYDFGRLPSDYPNPKLRGTALTGLTVPEPRASWQRATSVSSTADDSSGFQIHCYDAGSFINTWASPYQVVVDGGPHAIYGYAFDDPLPPAFDGDPATDLVLQVSLEVPWLVLWPSQTTGDQAVGQVSLFAYFRERTTGKLFAVLMLLFDNRLAIAGTFAPYVADDLHTPFVDMPLNSSAGYATLSPASSSATGVPWSGLRFFRGHISQDNFRSMLHDINAYCANHRDAPFCEPVPSSTNAFTEDVTSYDVEEFGVLHEIGRLPDSNISMGVHLFDLGVWNFR